MRDRIDALRSAPRWQWLLILLVAMLAGSAVPLYVGAIGEGAAKLAALPAAIILLFALFFSRVSLLLILIFVRAATELVFESSRFPIAGAEIGIGGLINGVAIVIVAMLLIEKPARFSREIVVVWGAFMALVVAGAFISPDRGAAIRFALQLLSDVAVFTGAFYVTRSAKDFRSCVLLIIASSLLPAAYGLYEYFGGFAEFYEDAGIRVKSTFGHPNVFAFYLTVVLSLTFYAVKSPLFTSSRFRKSVGVLYLFVLMLLLLLTKTRSAWVAAIFVFVGYGLLFERRYLVYLVLGGFLALLVPGVAERFGDLQTTTAISSQAQGNSYEWRKALWESAFDSMSGPRYVTGFGLSSFPFLAPTFFKDALGVNWSAHSVFVQLIFELGITGLVAFLWIFGRLAHRFLALRAWDRLGTYVLLVLMVEYLVECYSDNMLDYLSFNWYVWFLFGSALALTLLPGAGNPRAPQPTNAMP